ncbi:MAG TPA: hypothetical protein VMX74_01765 [Pirellulales bacterium]|nr:hypothetical protein [Pirellulales bacterium]
MKAAPAEVIDGWLAFYLVDAKGGSSKHSVSPTAAGKQLSRMFG